jgi:gamma-glutamyl hydrolase
MKKIYLIILLNILKISLEYKPVIGIYGVVSPSDDYSKYNKETLDEALVRWLEDEGAKIILIHHWYSHEILDEITSKINGILLPGVLRKKNSLDNLWESNAKYLINKSIEKKIPIIGICRGFLLLSSIIGNNMNILSSYNNKRAFNVEIIPESFKAKLFSLFEPKNFEEMKNLLTTPFYHIRGIIPNDFKKNKILNENFIITSYGYDKNGKKFVGSIESKNMNKFQIYGLQFHPEKAPYIRHPRYKNKQTNDTIQRSQLIALFFVNECKKNNHKFTENDFQKFDFIDTYNRNKNADFDYEMNTFTFYKDNKRE